MHPMQETRIGGWSAAAIGAGFIVAGIISFPEGGGLGPFLGFTLIGLALLLVGVLLLRIASSMIKRDAKLAWAAAHGIAGTATVTGIAFSGSVIGGEVQYNVTVNVSLPERLIYQATTPQLIPRTELSRFDAGTTFPCRVLQEDPEVVVLIDDAGLARTTPAALAGGVPGRARVLGTFLPPPSQQAEPVWGLRLRVEVDDGRPPYKINLTTVRPEGQQRPRRGTILPVKIDPEEPRRVVIDWSAIAAPDPLPSPAARPPTVADTPDLSI
jgi:hypothetical protein